MLFLEQSNKLNLKYQEARRFRRHKLENTFIINQEGVCQVFDLSVGGISFGCSKYLKFTGICNVDIVNNSGVHIWDLPIKKIWAEKNNTHSSSSIYTVRVGAQFNENLSPEQLYGLNQLLELPRQDSLLGTSKHNSLR